MFSVMMAEMDEYDELIRSRMAEIDAEEYPGAIGYTALEDGLSAGESVGAEENIAVEETAGAEENLDTGDADESGSDDAAQSDSKAA